MTERPRWLGDLVVAVGLVIGVVVVGSASLLTAVGRMDGSGSSSVAITVVVPTQVIQWPTATITPTPTPTRTPYPTIPPAPTVPAYSGQTEPGLYVIPARTIPVPTSIVEWPRCEELAATPEAPAYDRTCEVR